MNIQIADYESWKEAALTELQMELVDNDEDPNQWSELELQSRYSAYVTSNLRLVHNNIDYPLHAHVWSDDKYDYAIVNGESITRYFGPNGGDYESYPLHLLKAAATIIDCPGNEWIHQTLVTDMDTTKLYKHYKELRINLVKEYTC